jgi:predicted transcriptional regulator
MKSEEFKKKVRDSMINSGIMIENDESILSKEKLIDNETDESLMLVGPNKEAWVFVASFWPEEEIDRVIKEFFDLVKKKTQELLSNRVVTINDELSVKTYLEGLAKMFSGKAPTAKIGTAKLSELIEEAIKPIV